MSSALFSLAVLPLHTREGAGQVSLNMRLFGRVQVAWLLILLVLVEDGCCESDAGLPVTAPTSLQPGKQATFGWE